ncbi:MAG: hypothetical protein IJ336_03325 [Lachnospiraceae bacterium]|nr:hypothetical protein [Lachnospiraceae bacterium]MBQ7832592.1 hypothetical protein [Lachnospiraceae bacterium]
MLTINGYDGKLIIKMADRNLVYDYYCTSKKNLMDKVLETISTIDEDLICDWMVKIKKAG